MRDGGKERDLSYEDLCSDYDFLFPIEERILMIPDVIRANVVDDIKDEVVKLCKELHLKMKAIKLRRPLHAHIKKAVPVLPARACTRARARSYRSHRKTAAASSSSGDDDGGDSDSSDPPARRYLPHVIPKILQTYRFFLSVVYPRHMWRSLSEGRWAA